MLIYTRPNQDIHTYNEGAPDRGPQNKSPREEKHDASRSPAGGRARGRPAPLPGAYLFSVTIAIIVIVIILIIILWLLLSTIKRH